MRALSCEKTGEKPRSPPRTKQKTGANSLAIVFLFLIIGLQEFRQQAKKKLGRGLSFGVA
jgi:hypothetical protein